MPRNLLLAVLLIFTVLGTLWTAPGVMAPELAATGPLFDPDGVFQLSAWGVVYWILIATGLSLAALGIWVQEKILRSRSRWRWIRTIRAGCAVIAAAYTLLLAIVSLFVDMGPEFSAERIGADFPLYVLLMFATVALFMYLLCLFCALPFATVAAAVLPRGSTPVPVPAAPSRRWSLPAGLAGPLEAVLLAGDLASLIYSGVQMVRENSLLALASFLVSLLLLGMVVLLRWLRGAR